MVFIDQYRHAYGVESICRVMQVAPSSYWRYAAQQRNPELRCARAQRDDVPRLDIERVWQANLQIYGADKVWRQLRREGTEVVRCTLERLMRKTCLRDVMRGKVVRSMRADFVLDALEQTLYARQPERNELAHASDRGSQYDSIKYSERLVEAGIEPSVGSKEEQL